MYNLFSTAICLGEKTKLIVFYKSLFVLDECFVTCLAGAQR